MQIQIGNKVWLADESSKAASGRVVALGGNGVFHHRVIPPHYVRVHLQLVVLNVPLMVPVEEADQATLSDALESSVLWSKACSFPKEWVTRWPFVWSENACTRKQEASK